jgi:hypothetical protein
MTIDINAVTKEQENAGLFVPVSAQFVSDSSNRVYTYKCPVNLKPKARDLAIIETNTGYKIVRIMSVCEGDKLDYDVSYKYRWIIGLVSLSEYIQLRIEESIRENELKFLCGGDSNEENKSKTKTRL